MSVNQTTDMHYHLMCEQTERFVDLGHTKYQASCTRDTEHDIDFVQDALQKEYPQLTLCDRESSGHAEERTLRDGFYSILKLTLRNKDLTMEVSSFDPALSEGCAAIIQKIAKEIQKTRIYIIGQDSEGVCLSPIGYLDSDLERGNYEDNVLTGLDYIVQQFSEPVPNGRIAIFNGSPGTGKSHAIRGIIPQIKNCIPILVPAKMLGQLDGPTMATMLMENRTVFSNRGGGVRKSILLILEDADTCLAPRDDGNIGEISSLLNMADGIFGSMLDVRIIATTNVDSMDFDDALIRPGRLCKHIHIQPLSRGRANQVFERLSGIPGVYTKATTLAQVYADALGADTSGIVGKPAERKLGFGS